MRYILIVLLLFLVIACVPQVDVDKANPADTQIANPASVYCEEQGGMLSIVDGEDGQYGICTLSDGTECEEWAYYRGECPEEKPDELILEKPETISGGNIIEIREDAFYPNEKTIKKNTEIKWIKKDTRLYKIACYLGGDRVILSSELKENDFFTYTFLEEGEYTCITFPYGLRNVITVGSSPFLSPIGGVVGVGGSPTLGAGLIIAIAILAAIILFFFIYGRKSYS